MEMTFVVLCLRSFVVVAASLIRSAREKKVWPAAKVARWPNVALECERARAKRRR